MHEFHPLAAVAGFLFQLAAGGKQGVLVVVPDPDGEEEQFDPAAFAGAFERVAPAQPVVATVVEGEEFASAVLSDIDGLVVGGGLAPAYLAAVQPLIDEIRLLVADGLPYLGYSSGAMIAADRAIVGGWRMDGVPVCPAETVANAV